MRKGLKKRLILTASAIILVSMFILIPPAIGYGDGYDDAQELSNGSYNHTLSSGDTYAYYKVCCRTGNNLYVSLTTDYPSYDLDLYLYDRTPSLVDSSLNIGASDTVQETCERTGPYYIKVKRYSGAGSAPMTIVITGATGSCTRVPGFALFPALLGLLFIMFYGFVLLKKRNSLPF